MIMKMIEMLFALIGIGFGIGIGGYYGVLTAIKFIKLVNWFLFRAVGVFGIKVKKAVSK